MCWCGCSGHFLAVGVQHKLTLPCAVLCPVLCLCISMCRAGVLCASPPRRQPPMLLRHSTALSWTAGHSQCSWTRRHKSALVGCCAVGCTQRVHVHSLCVSGLAACRAVSKETTTAIAAADGREECRAAGVMAVGDAGGVHAHLDRLLLCQQFGQACACTPSWLLLIGWLQEGAFGGCFVGVEGLEACFVCLCCVPAAALRCCVRCMAFNLQ